MRVIFLILFISIGQISFAQYDSVFYEGLKGYGNVINGKRDGHWTFWYPNGHKQSEGQYKKDIVDGVWKNYYESGKLFYIAEYKEGTPTATGVWKAFYEKDRKEFPDNLYGVLAVALKKDGDMTGAIGFSNKAIELNKTDYRLRAIRADCYIELDQLEMALHDLNFVVSKDRSSQSLLLRGQVLCKMKSYSSALRDTEEAIKLNGNSGEAYAIRALIHLKLNDNNKACVDFKKAKQLGITDKFEIEKHLKACR